MALTLYMDQHVPKAITVGLRLRGVDVVTAYEDGAAELKDLGSRGIGVRSCNAACGVEFGVRVKTA
jgi:hypothetical protein